MTSTAEAVGFWLLAPLAVLGALGLVFARRAVHAALGMALTMCILGVFYLMQRADFLGIVQVFVYTGAVMMLFLFVLMLVGIDSSDSLIETLKGQRWAAGALVLGLTGLLIAAVGGVASNEARVTAGMQQLEQSNKTTGNVTGIAQLIFGQYVWIFEITSALLVTAALGAMVLAHRERIFPKLTQADRAARRVRDNEHVAGLPAPGVYSRHNAVDTPALLPDGSTSDLSVSRVLVARDQIATAKEYMAVERDLEDAQRLEREIEKGSEK